jgi:hypothetical protein
MLLEISWTIECSPAFVPAKAPASPCRGFLFAKRRSVATGPRTAAPLMLCSCVRDREPRAHGQGRELIDRVAAGAPVPSSSSSRRSGMRGCHSPGSGRVTAPGSSWPQSMRIVQRKRRPTVATLEARVRDLVERSEETEADYPGRGRDRTSPGLSRPLITAGKSCDLSFDAIHLPSWWCPGRSPSDLRWRFSS